MERADRLKAERQALRALAISRLRILNLDEIAQEVLAAREIESLEYHLQRHGEYLGVATHEEYVARLAEHLQRIDLIHFVLARRQRDLMWYAAAIDTGVTAQYNIDRKRVWSFFRAPDLQRFVKISGVVWIEQRQGKWVIVDEEANQ